MFDSQQVFNGLQIFLKVKPNLPISAEHDEINVICDKNKLSESDINTLEYNGWFLDNNSDSFWKHFV